MTKFFLILSWLSSSGTSRVRQLELYGRANVRASKRISNPGCYATSTQLLIAPLLPYLAPPAWPTVFGVSGYSGAGTVIQAGEAGARPVSLPKVTPESLGGGIRPYSLTDHIHEREAGWHLSKLLPAPTDLPTAPTSKPRVQLAFIPTVAPFFSGILSTLSFPLSTSTLSASDIASLYASYYTGERLVRTQKGVPALGDVQGQHGWVVGGIQVHSGLERVVVVGGLDNLLKGAATQCLQVRSRASFSLAPSFFGGGDCADDAIGTEFELGAWV